MKVTETLNEGFKRAIKVEISAKTLAEKLNDKLKEAKSTVRLNGFRPGKVPEKHLRQLYGKSFMAEIVNDLLQEKSHSILEDRKERSVAVPEIDLTNDEKEIEKILKGESDLTFTLNYEVLPDIAVKELKDVHITRHIAKIDSSQIDKEVEHVLESTRSFSSKKGAAKNGDRIVMDYVGMIDGKPFDNGADKDATLVLGSNTFIPGFEDQLIGVKAGDKKEITVTFPTGYPAAHLAGKEACFDIHVKAVEKADPLEVNDESAKKLGVESLEKLRVLIAERLEHQYGPFTRQKVKRQLLDVLDKEYKLDVPPSLVNKEFENIWHQVKAELAQSGKTFEDEKTTEAEAENEYRAIAERRVRLGLVIAAIGEKAGVTVSEQELQGAVLEQLRHYPGQEKEVMEFFRKNPSAIANLKAPLFEEKVIDHLLAHVKVSDIEVSPEELMRDEQDSESGSGTKTKKAGSEAKKSKTTQKKAQKSAKSDTAK